MFGEPGPPRPTDAERKTEPRRIPELPKEESAIVHFLFSTNLKNLNSGKFEIYRQSSAMELSYILLVLNLLCLKHNPIEGQHYGINDLCITARNIATHPTLPHVPYCSEGLGLPDPLTQKEKPNS